MNKHNNVIVMITEQDIIQLVCQKLSSSTFKHSVKPTRKSMYVPKVTVKKRKRIGESWLKNQLDSGRAIKEISAKSGFSKVSLYAAKKRYGITTSKTKTKAFSRKLKTKKQLQQHQIFSRIN